MMTGYQYFGARYYDSDLSVFLSVDRFTDKYPSLTPYHYTANNPINLIDINGDSVNVSELLSKYKDVLIKGLGKLTGLSLYENKNGMLEYDKEAEINGGSKFARKALIKAIEDDKSNIDVVNTTNGSFYDDENDVRTIGIDFEGISKYEFSKELNPLTEGAGMQFFHELSHDNLFGTRDPDANSSSRALGGAVMFTNKIRRQMGKDFGQKWSYHHFSNENWWQKGKGYEVYMIYDKEVLNNLLKLKQKPSSYFVKYHQ